MSGKVEKARFAALPHRAINDQRLTRSHLVVLACIAWHDRMSSVRKTGQGAWMSRDTIARETSCHPVNVSSIISELCKWEYIDRQRHHLDGRKHTYRVNYDLSEPLDRSSTDYVSDDDKGSAQATDPEEIGSPAANKTQKIGSTDPQKTTAKSETSPSQYISLSDVRYFEESTKGYSEESAQLALRDTQKEHDPPSLGASLAKLERLLKSEPQKVDTNLWLPWLDELLESMDVDHPCYRWATRLDEELYTLGEARSEQAGGSVKQ